MFHQTDPADLPSLTEMIPATGAVCPRNRVMVASTSPNVGELSWELRNQSAWKIRLASELAMIIMLRLNVICCAFSFAPFRGQHWTAVEAQATIVASAIERFTTAVSRNGKFMDMLPSMPGNFTFILDVAAANARTASVR